MCALRWLQAESLLRAVRPESRHFPFQTTRALPKTGRLSDSASNVAAPLARRSLAARSPLAMQSTNEGFEDKGTQDVTDTNAGQACSVTRGGADGPWGQCFTGVQLHGSLQLGAAALVYDISHYGTDFWCDWVAVSKASIRDIWGVRATAKNRAELAALVGVVESPNYLSKAGLTVFFPHWSGKRSCKGCLVNNPEKAANLWRAATRHMETQMNDALSVGKSDMFVVVRDGPPEFPVQTVQIWACQRFSLANVWRLVCKEPPWWAI